MTARRPLLALALVSALTGCVSAPPSGPIVEYRSGSPTVTGKVPCDAKYTLVTRDENEPRNTFGEHCLQKGQQLGFRSETDGSVTALAPGFTRLLPPGSYAWEAVASSIPSERERWLCEASKHVSTAAKVTGVVVAVAAFTLLVIIAATFSLNYM